MSSEREQARNAMTLLDEVRARVQTYQWDSAEDFQEATEIANDIIALVGKTQYHRGFDEAKEMAAQATEAKRWEVLNLGHDEAWTEPYVELAAAIRALERKA